MTHAYSELYVSNAKLVLAHFFSRMIDDYKIDADIVTKIFSVTGYAAQFERGNPSVVAGMSGLELADRVLETAYGGENPESYTEAAEESVVTYRAVITPAYWAGWALAEYQWFTGRRFDEIFRQLPLSQIMLMYSPYHEMDVMTFVEDLEERIQQAIAASDTRLKTIRERAGLSQSELAKAAGVHIRSIQMYEQRQNDIDKAQGQTLFKLSRALGCKIEDLLESPSL